MYERTKVTRERRGEIVQKILEILNENHEGLHRNELLKQLEQRVVLTEHESGFYDEEKQNRRFEQMAQFHTIGPTKAGWIIKNKGVWKISEEGRQALRDFNSPTLLIQESRKIYSKWHEENKLNDHIGKATISEKRFLDKSYRGASMKCFQKSGISHFKQKARNQKVEDEDGNARVACVVSLQVLILASACCNRIRTYRKWTGKLYFTDWFSIQHLSHNTYERFH